METVNFLAQLWGFSTIIISLALLMNPRSIEELWKMSNQEGTYALWGIIGVVLGVASILAYNVWDESWHVLISLLGWVTLLKGTINLFMPQYTKNMLAKMKAKKDGLMFLFAAAVVFGCVLLYFGFAA